MTPSPPQSPLAPTRDLCMQETGLVPLLLATICTLAPTEVCRGSRHSFPLATPRADCCNPRGATYTGCSRSLAAAGTPRTRKRKKKAHHLIDIRELEVVGVVLAGDASLLVHGRVPHPQGQVLHGHGSFEVHAATDDEGRGPEEKHEGKKNPRNEGWGDKGKEEGRRTDRSTTRVCTPKLLVHSNKSCV